MDYCLWLLAAVALCWFMAYNRSSLITFTLSFIALMAFGTFLDVVSFVSWVVFASIMLPLNISSVRKQYISLPLLKMFRAIMPDMSATEQEALGAGTTWFEADLFRGNPDWNKLHNYPQPRLSAEEQAFLNGPVEEVCRMVDDWETCHERADLSPEVWQYLKRQQILCHDHQEKIRWP